MEFSFLAYLWVDSLSCLKGAGGEGAHAEKVSCFVFLSSSDRILLVMFLHFNRIT
jgi:hypothetical protein